MTNLQEHQAILLELLREFDRICKKHNLQYMLFAGSALGAVRHKGFIPWDDDLDVVMLRPHYERFLQVAPAEAGDLYYVQGEFSDHWPMNFSKLRKNNTTCLEKYHPKDPKTHQGIYIDIFPCDNASDSQLVRKIQYYSSRIVLAKALARRGYETNSKLKKLFMAGCSILPIKPFYRMALQRKAVQSKLVHTFFGGTSKFEKGLLQRKWLTETVDMEFEGVTVPVSAYYDALLTALYGDYMTIPPEEDRKCKAHAILIDTTRPYTDYEHYRDGMEFEVYTRSIR